MRGQYLPIVSLAGFFPSDSGQVTTDPTRAILVIVEAGGQQLALQVDELIGQQFVVKNLESNYRKVEGVAGATIMGDGRVA
jgi:two-component system chemotaxis sensor kinase CheA